MKKAAIFGALAFASACTASIGPANENTGQGGSAPDGVGGHASPGAAGSGGTSSGSAGTGAPGGGAGAPGGVAGMGDVGTIYKNPPAFTPAAGVLRRFTRKQLPEPLPGAFGDEGNGHELDAD